MELRSPPATPVRAPRRDRRFVGLANLVLALALVALGLLFLRSRAGQSVGEPDRDREVAARLLAAGALDEAADLYGSYLGRAVLEPSAAARIAYSVGSAYLDAGRYERALRWFYEAEARAGTAGALPDGLDTELSRKVVHTLERLGRVHAARAALAARSGLPDPETPAAEDDPILARVGSREIRRSELERVLDGLPPEASGALGPEARAELLRRYVAEELVYAKASKLEYDADPVVRARLEQLHRQLVVGRFVEKEIVGGLEIDPADVETYYEANRERFRRADDPESEPPPFESVAAAVEQEYRREKVQRAYERLLEEELGAASVELFPERWGSE